MNVKLWRVKKNNFTFSSDSFACVNYVNNAVNWFWPWMLKMLASHTSFLIYSFTSSTTNWCLFFGLINDTSTHTPKFMFVKPCFTKVHYTYNTYTWLIILLLKFSWVFVGRCYKANSTTSQLLQQEGVCFKVSASSLYFATNSTETTLSSFHGVLIWSQWFKGLVFMGPLQFVHQVCTDQLTVQSVFCSTRP